MKCEICKRNTASFYKFVPQLGKQAPVCPACLNKTTGAPDTRDLFTVFGTQEIPETHRGLYNVVCPNCGFEFDDYFEMGRFGCVRCYDVFHDKIMRIVTKIHGNTHHNGSRPTGGTKNVH